jgi:hypothetical protein
VNVHLTYLFLFLALISAPLSGGTQDSSDDLKIDPRLIAEAVEVWSIIASGDNDVWPGWDASGTPILFYLPGQQDVLINHPAPPDGFAPYTGPVSFPAGKIFVKDGPTIIGFDGQNTSRKIGGVDTLVVADTLSNMRMRLLALADDPRPTREKMPAGDYSVYGEDIYGQMVMIAHEAFHVHQGKMAPGKGGNELALRNYPVLSVDNNVGFALEGAALAEAMRGWTREECREAALRWLAIRLHRRGKLSEEAVAYEDGTEFNEGLAKYVEYRISEEFEGREPGEAMKWLQGFHGFEDLSAFRDNLVEQMTQHMNGEVNVNNDPYGTAPLRMRLYFSGMAIAVILDELAPDWRDKIFAPGTTLTGLASAAIAAEPGELDKALAMVKRDPAHDILVGVKRRLEAAGRDEIGKQLDSILHGPKTLLTLEYSALGTKEPTIAFTPFGISGVDENRTIYKMTPVSARLGMGYVFVQKEALAVLHDSEKRLFQFQLTEKMSRADLARALGLDEVPVTVLKNISVDLPGVHVQAAKALFRWEGDALIIAMQPFRR